MRTLPHETRICSLTDQLALAAAAVSPGRFHTAWIRSRETIGRRGGALL